MISKASPCSDILEFSSVCACVSYQALMGQAGDRQEALLSNLRETRTRKRHRCWDKAETERPTVSSQILRGRDSCGLMIFQNS